MGGFCGRVALTGGPRNGEGREGRRRIDDKSEFSRFVPPTLLAWRGKLLSATLPAVSGPVSWERGIQQISQTFGFAPFGSRLYHAGRRF